MIRIALAFDESYAVHGATTIQSILSNKSERDRIQFYIIDTGLSGESKAAIEHLAQKYGSSVSFLEVRDDFWVGLPNEHHALSTYARLALADLLDDQDKVLYLDSDLVVLGSLEPLWETKIDEYTIAAVPDAMTIFRGSALEYWKEIGLPESAKYFSAGVLLLNLARWRKEKIETQLRNWIEQNSEKMAHSDQTALNAVLAGTVKYLHFRWNLQAPLVEPVTYGWGATKEQLDAVNNPRIVHFTGAAKPWRLKYRVPFAEKYWKFREQLQWRKKERFTFWDVCFRIRQEWTAVLRSQRTFLRWILGRIPEPRDQ